MLKALGLIGLGRGRAVRLRTDDQERIVPGGLPELDAPAIVCLQAGNVNSGASDPFAPLIDWAHAFDTLRAARRSSYRRGSQAAQARRGQRVPNKN